MHLFTVSPWIKQKQLSEYLLFEVYLEMVILDVVIKGV